MNGGSALRERASGALLASFGAAVVGAICGLPEGAPSILRHALVLPIIVIGVAAVMLPSLYIGGAALEFAPPAAAFEAAVRDAMRHAGRVLLGFAAPLAVLVATSSLWATVWILSNIVLGLAALLAVRSIWYALFDKQAHRPMWIYLLWLAVGMSIGEHLFMATLN